MRLTIIDFQKWFRLIEAPAQKWAAKTPHSLAGQYATNFNVNKLFSQSHPDCSSVKIISVGSLIF